MTVAEKVERIQRLRDLFATGALYVPKNWVELPPRYVGDGEFAMRYPIQGWGNDRAERRRHAFPTG